jgi:2-dehydro-3-deoxyphosphogluconate aldolase/(4S)-4-hydroxy-2-oxoglutarate aldolase
MTAWGPPEPASPRPALPDAITRTRVIAILRGEGPEQVAERAAALAAAGVRALEVTMNSPDPLGALHRVAARHPELLLGAGTVLTVAAAEAAIVAGARFLVSPHTDTRLIAWAAARGVPMLPGTQTPTEIVSAWTAGAAAVKLFPASALGPSAIREIHGPLPAIPIVPTGGVSPENARAFLDAGAVAVGLGSALTAGPPEQGAENARRVLAALAAA